MATIYSAHIEVGVANPSREAITQLLDALASYHAAVGTSPRGWLDAQIAVPGESIHQATTTALSVIQTAVGGAAIVGVTVMTGEEFNAREGFARVPPLLSATEAAQQLGVSAQRIRKMLEEHRFPGAQRIGTVWVIPQSEVDARAAQRRHR